MTEVDILYSNSEVFSDRRTILSPVVYWLYTNVPSKDWKLVDRDPEDPFAGETFQFREVQQALLFKLAWGGL